VHEFAHSVHACGGPLCGNRRGARGQDPDDRQVAWIENLFSHVKAEWPHLDRIRDPDALRTELAVVRLEHNAVRLHAAIGYVSPEDEHQGRSARIRATRRRGLRHARWARIAHHRIQQAKANRRSPTNVD
jgi:putative transposase